MLARILAGSGGDLCRQKIHDHTVLVGRPNRAVLPKEARPGALFATEALRTIEQSLDEPFEPDRRLAKSPPELFHDSIDHAAADQGLGNRSTVRPVRAVHQQIAY